MEIELKLLLSPADVAAFRGHPLLKQWAIAKPRQQQLTSVYFDTPDLYFRRHDAALRVRSVGPPQASTAPRSEGRELHAVSERGGQMRRAGPPQASTAPSGGRELHAVSERGGQMRRAGPPQASIAPSGGRELHAVSERGGQIYWVQTLKGGGQVAAGLHQREEWESRVDGPQPDLAALVALVGPDSAWAELLAAVGLADRLVPVFTTRLRRTIWQLRLVQGDEVELALDQGEVQHGAARRPVSEIELELKSGDPARLYDFTLALLETVPLRVGNISKAERGYALYAPHPPAVVEAARLELATGLTVEQGFQAIVGNCLAQVQGNEAGITRGSDPESVHQMRVGMRRLRSALRLFGDVAPCPDALRKELDWLAGELGAARPDDVPWTGLQQAAVDVARKNRQKAAAAVRSVRYARLMLSLGGWLQGARWREALAQPEQEALAAPLARFATQTLARRHGTLKKRGKRLHDGTPQLRHRVRIAAKKVRYAAEFFHSLYPVKRLRPYIATLTNLQDSLGGLNDASVADGLLRQLTQTRPELAHSTGFVRGYLSSRSEREVRKLGKLWQRFARLKRVGRP
jgi:triphosphatase